MISSQQNAPRPSLVLPGDRPSEVVAFEAEMVAFFVDAADLLGVPKSVAAIYGVISKPKYRKLEEPGPDGEVVSARTGVFLRVVSG